LNLVCLTADTDLSLDVGVNGTVVTTSVIDEYNSTVTGTWDPSTLATLEPLPFPSLAPRQDSSSSSDFCLVQSYDWVGTDIIRPDCDDSANVNASQCINPTDVPSENSRIANLYPDDLLCSKCFLNMFYLRLSSPYLPDLDQSDFLVEQWFDILDVCNVTNSSMPELIVRDLPFYDSAPGTVGGWVDNTTEAIPDPQPLTGNQTYNSTCTSRIITFDDLDEPDIDWDTQVPCDVIPLYLNASTGDVQQMMGSSSCLPSFNTTEIPSVCAPLICTVEQMQANSTW
jgi:hypothetical protein